MRKPSFMPLTPGARRRLMGMAQNIVIAALVVSTALLAGGRAGFDLFGGRTAAGQETLGENAGGREYVPAAEPLCVVATPGEGVHSAAMYSARSLDEYNALYSAALAEALGSAGEPEAVTDAEWREALSSPGVYFDYYTDCQLSTYAIWLGSAMSSDAATHSARRICLSLGDGAVTLYYLRERGVDTRTAYRCSTELSYTELAERVNESVPNGAQFAFELDGEFEGLDPCAVLTEGVIELRGAAGENTIDAVEPENILAAFGMNANLARSYTEADGSVVYLEGTTSLRLGADGALSYASREPGDADALTPSDAVELTHRILERTALAASLEAGMRLSYIAYDLAAGTYTIRYDYCLDGLPLSLQQRECAAEFTLSGESVVGAEIIFRGYSYSAAAEHPLPARLAAALVDAGGGGEPRLVFIDSNGAVRADWISV